MKHLNGNQFVVVDILTTGPDERRHDILEFAALPLDGKLEVAGMPFDAIMIPQRREFWNLDELKRERKYMDQAIKRKICFDQKRVYSAALKGIDPMDAAEYFVKFAERLNLRIGKKMIPIAHNWPFVKGFLVDWLGYTTVDMLFEQRYRDIMCMSVYDNDRAGWLDEEFPYPKNNFEFLCSRLEIHREKSHHPLTEVGTIRQVFRTMIQNLARTNLCNLPLAQVEDESKCD